MLGKQILRFLAQQKISGIFVGILALVGSATVGFINGLPIPQVHDEFSYLLAADTFVHGRITNSAHPMWEHFETIHVIQQPSYMSRYMPAQGMFLALGKILVGHPIFGVWLSMAFMCGAITWMLGGWVPNRWALLGGIFAIVHPNFGVGNYWAQSYWGGAVSAAGGALLIGGARRLMVKPRMSYALASSVGLVILANSRPFEGLLLSLPIGLMLLIWLIKNRRAALGRVTVRQVVPVFAAVGVMTSASMAYYNYRITGNPMQFPYLVYERTYSASALLIWQQLPPKPNYRHKIMEDFHTKYEVPFYHSKHSIWGFIKINLATLAMYLFVAGNVFAIPVIVSARQLLAWSWKNRWGRFAFLTYALFALGMMIPNYSLPHYWAPVTGLNHLFVLQGIRFWRIRDPRSGRLIAYAIPLLGFILLSLSSYHSINSYDARSPHVQRAKLLERLEQDKGKHLILVKYILSRTQYAVFEWVYNEADIDGAKVVWARDMGLPKNCELINYFSDRLIWSLEVDHQGTPIQFARFPPELCR